MYKTTCFIAALLAFVSIANGLSLVMYDNNSDFKLKAEFFPDDQGAGDVRFTGSLPNLLGWPEATTSVCFYDNDGDGNASDGAFAVDVYCFTKSDVNFWDSNLLTEVRVDQWNKQQAELEWSS